MNKIDFLNFFIHQHQLDMIGIGETWLLPSTPSSFVSLTGYSLFRGDTDGATRKHGVCLYVSNKVKCLEVTVGLPNVCVVHIVDSDLWCIVVYRPPSYNDIQNAILLNFLTNFSEGKEVVIIGDFNLPSINWSRNDVVDNYITPVDRLFLECFNSSGLNQWVRESTFVSGSILDLVLTSELDRIGEVCVLPPFPRCSHSPVIFDYVFDFQEVVEERTEKYLWHKGRYDKIVEALVNVDWDFEFAHRSVSDNYNFFQTMLIRLVQQHVPLRRPGVRPWCSSPPSSLLRERADAWETFKSSRVSYGRRDDRTAQAFTDFKVISERCRNFGLHSRCAYEARLIAQIKINPKLFHSYIWHKKVGCPSVGPLKLASGRLISEPYMLCEEFASVFSSIFVSEDPIDPAPNQSSELQMTNITISMDRVAEAIKALDANSAMGPDGVHPMVLKSCIVAVVYPLSIIFEKSLDLGILPETWKKSSVVPIFKSKSRYDPSNYRPVSLTSICCKTMERVIAAQLVTFLENNNLLSSNQYGFRQNRSTEDQLLLTYGDVASWVDCGSVVDVVFLDFSKAFDVVCHTVLLQKLRSIGLPDLLLTWVHCFLVGRTMRVSCGGCSSREVAVLSGVPQGSVLGPLLFLIYINHVSSGISSCFKAFADDYKLYLKFSGGNRCEVVQSVSQLQVDLNLFYEVALSWNLSLNTDKCVAMRFGRGTGDWRDMMVEGSYTIGGVPLKFVDLYKDLGVIIDNSLKFHQHVHSVVQRAWGLASNILRSTVNRSPDFMVTLFRSHIRPILDYCSCVWNVGYVGDQKLLESVQRRWTKRVDGLGDVQYEDRLRLLGLFSIYGRLLRSDIIKYWRSFHSGSDDMRSLFQLAPGIGTRGHHFKLSVIRCNTDIRKRFWSQRCVTIWNSLPSELVEITGLTVFKRTLVDFLGDRMYEYH